MFHNLCETKQTKNLFNFIVGRNLHFHIHFHNLIHNSYDIAYSCNLTFTVISSLVPAPAHTGSEDFSWNRLLSKPAAELTLKTKPDELTQNCSSNCCSTSTNLAPPNQLSWSDLVLLLSHFRQKIDAAFHSSILLFALQSIITLNLAYTVAIHVAWQLTFLSWILVFNYLLFPFQIIIWSH